MRQSASLRLPLVLVMTLLAAVPGALRADDDSPETLIEQQRALEAELSPGAGATDRVSGPNALVLGPGPLFIGVDDITVPAYRLEVPAGTPTQAFLGFEVWGSAYDATNDRVLFNDGSTLYEWPVGGVPNLLGTIVDGGGATQVMVGLAWYNDTLYGTKNIANEAIWIIDPVTLVASVFIDYVDADLDCGGVAVDQSDGTFYCTNDDATPHGAGLVIVNPDTTVTFVAAYEGAENDVDGLAVGGGKAYMITDDNTPATFSVWDLAGGAYDPPIPNPWTSSEVFSGGAWIAAGGPPSVCSTPALPIPDNNPAGADDSLVFAENATINDLDLSIDASHTWVGDLIFTITHVDTGTSAVIVDRPGVPASTFGCSGDDIAATLDDEAATPIEDECAAATPTIDGAFTPNNPLSAFDGEDINGTWTLNVSDSAGGDTGTLNEWCMVADTTTVVLEPDIDVSPASLSSFQEIDSQVTVPLDISNLGTADLNWAITEDAGVRPIVLPVPGRQQPLRQNRPGVIPPSNEASAGAETFSRAAVEGEAQRVAPERGEVPDGTVTITHSVTQNIVALNSVSCNAGGLHTNNSYIRAFDLPTFGISGNFEITQVEIGIEQATGAGGMQPADVNLYIWDPLDPFTFANFVPIGTAAASIPDQSLTIATIPVSGTAPAGSVLVVEFFTPNGQAAGNSLFVGSNPDGQTAPTFLAAADCGISEPTDTAVIGFPNMHLVMNVTGQAGCDVDLPWVSTNPSAGTTAPAGTTAVDVTFDSTGLMLGEVVTGALCIDSDDPDEAQVLVPLTLEVDTMPFIDGFESGDTSAWSFTTP